MSAFESTTVIEVRAWGQRVGAIADGGIRGAYTFEYDPSWVRTGIELAPILMPVSGIRRNRRFAFPGMSLDTFKGLPPAMADLLPDRFGNAIVDAWLAQEGIPASDITALDRLAYLGARGLGALTFSPAHALDGPPTAINLSDLIVAARDVVHGTLSTDEETRSALRQIIDVGTSAGGARAKAVVNINDETNEIRAVHTVPRPGYSAWLLKFDGIGIDRELGVAQNYGRIERAYALMAAAAGVSVPETGLIEENGRAHFITKRFDRVDGGRLHMQSLCGLAGLDFNERGVHDYAQLFTTIDQLALGQSAKQEAFRRMVFNVAAANNDDHTKNHSFLMDSEGTWSLSPAYDVTHAYNPNSIWTSQHLMSVNGKFADAKYKDFIAVSERHGIERAATIIGEVNDAVASWPEHAATAGVPARAQAEVAADLRSIRR